MSDYPLMQFLGKDFEIRFQCDPRVGCAILRTAVDRLGWGSDYVGLAVSEIEGATLGAKSGDSTEWQFFQAVSESGALAIDALSKRRLGCKKVDVEALSMLPACCQSCPATKQDLLSRNKLEDQRKDFIEDASRSLR